MKTIKFRRALSKLILSGEKTSTWRLFDDKDLSEGDKVSLVVWETKQEFAKAQIVSVVQKTLGSLTDEDSTGHERFSSKDKMYKTYEIYYNRPVNKETIVKIIKFKLI